MDWMLPQDEVEIEISPHEFCLNDSPFFAIFTDNNLNELCSG